MNGPPGGWIPGLAAEPLTIIELDDDCFSGEVSRFVNELADTLLQVEKLVDGLINSQVVSLLANISFKTNFSM